MPDISRRAAAGAVAGLAAAVAIACSGSHPASANGGGEFDAIARELVDRISSRGGAEPGAGGSIRVAVVPFDPQKSPVEVRRAEEVAAMLESALVRAAGPGVEVKARTGLGRVFAEIHKLGFDEDHRARAKRVLREAGDFDVMVVGALDLDREGALQASFQAIRLSDGGVIAATAGRAIEAAAAAAPDPMALAIRSAADRLVNAVSDLSILSTAGIRYRDTTHRTPFGEWFQIRLTQHMQNLVRDALTARSLAVRPLRIDSDALRDLHGQPIPDWTGALSAYPPLEAGHYVLAGHYWEGRDRARFKIGLYTQDGRVASVTDTVSLLDEEVAEFRLRPEGDFGFLTATDGRDAFRFGLTAHEGGRSPVYEIGDSIHLVVNSEIDAWISCYFWGRSGDGRYILTRILPNQAMRDGGLVRGGHSWTVPGLDPDARPNDPWPFEITAGGPPGEDLVKCFATDRDVADDLPPDLAGREFARLPDGAAERLSAAFRETGAKVAESSMVITIEGGEDDGA